MKKDFWAEALGEIRDKYIEEAAGGFARKNAPENGRRYRPWMKWAAAACLCLIAGAGLLWRFGVGYEDDLPDKPSGTGVVMSEDGVTIPGREYDLASLGEDATASMIPFVVYKGRTYEGCHRSGGVKWEYEENELPVNEYLGEATGLIDEWTKESGYVDFAGSVKGKLYNLKGYPEDFALALQDSENSWRLMINGGDVTLKKGSELYEDRLSLAGKYSTVGRQEFDDWDQGNGNVKTLSASYDEALERFVDELDEAQFRPCETAVSGMEEGEDGGETTESAKMEGTHIREKHDTVCFLYFHKKDGVEVTLRCLEGGYVIYEGMPDVYVQIPGNVFDEVCSVTKYNSGEGGGILELTEGEQAAALPEEKENGTDEKCSSWGGEVAPGEKIGLSIYKKKDAAYPYLKIGDQEISLKSAEDIWYCNYSLAQIDPIDLDGDGRSEILLRFPDGASACTKGFRVLKQDGNGKWGLLDVPQEVKLGDEADSFVRVKAQQDGKVQVSVPDMKFAETYDWSERVNDGFDVGAYLKKEGGKADVGVGGCYMSYEDNVLIVDYHIYVDTAAHIEGAARLTILYDKEAGGLKCHGISFISFEEVVSAGESE